MAVAVERFQSPAHAWPAVNGRTRFQPCPPAYVPESMLPDPPIPPHNDIELTRDMLITTLEYFSQLVAQLFTGRPIRMIVHGGACMLLHPGLYNLSQQQQQMIPSLPRRTTTRDVDYIHRSFVTELASCGMPDAAVKLQECIKTTARHFGLGADWMNSDADIALPMAHDPSGKVYDPIYTASIKQNNIDLHTIFRSTNGSLTLISVTPFWAVSLKLVRYTKWDPGDICLLLRNGMVLSGTNWTPETIENWLFRNCWAMGYHNFDSRKKADMRARINHAIKMLSHWSSAVKPPEKSISAHDAMGGGDVMGGGEFGGNNGWSYSFGTWPNQVQSQAQVSSVQFPTTTPAPAPVNVRDWATDNDPSRKKSRSPTGSYPHSRQSSTGKIPEIFIPPSDTNWINPNHAPVSFRPQSRDATPDPVDDRWNHVYPAESNNFRSGSRVPRADPYSVASFDRSINSMLHQSHHRLNTNLVIPANARPVIPLALTRKQNKKQRKKDIERERQSKRFPRNGLSDSDTSDSSDDEEPSRQWNIYAQPTTHQQPVPQPPQIRMPLPPMHPNSRSQSQQGPSGPGPHNPSQSDQPTTHQPPAPPLPQIRMAPPPIHSNIRSQSQQGLSAPQNPSQPPKHRPPHLNLTPPPVTQMPVPMTHMPQIGLHSPPQSLGPSELAQYQFEQQRQVYQFQQQQQQRLQQQQQQQHQQQQHQQHQHQHQQQPWG